MNKLITIGLSCFLCGFNLLAQQSIYNVRFSGVEEKKVFVDAELFLQDSVLIMSPNGPVPERWDDYVENLEAKSKSGDEIKITKREGKWIVQGPLEQHINISYEINVDHEDIEWPGGIDGVAFVKDWGFFLTGRSLFIFPEDNNDELVVKFDVDDPSKIQAPWPSSSKGYLVKDNTELTESLIIYGDHAYKKIEREDLKIRFVLTGEKIQADSLRYSQIADQVMNYYYNLMGGGPTPNGNQSTEVMVVINSASQTDGEVIGSHINMMVNPDAHPQEQMVAWFMFAHEFFHLWNGKTIMVNSTRDDWFKEGITNYYTLKALYQVGFINDQALAGIFNGLFYQRYMKDPGLGEISMRDAAEGFSKDDHWGLIYGGGLFVGIGMDMIIREETNNEKSLDDIMKLLYEKYKLKNEYYTSEEILKLASEMADKDLASFFDVYINGSTVIPIDEFLEKAGYHVVIENDNLIMTPKENLEGLDLAIREGFLGEVE
ncbi:M61 family metallopeptidase [Mangrovivirga cuniculi]|uniref:Peptidase M61 catalytic domain-containing protein n=1 Tax=Mangrovivirga cuniculi TaxID=2715131 RepID=A0A4D7JVZ7_9BACT|nr:hypothetical protein [Mangrovivirga cuniculi]QCK16692.1 hypothetical protein DCC35_19115 [Mangrovivirga cuniculi]